MAEKILVIGESGSGKSTAIKNLNPESTFIINVIGKPLPFKGWKGSYVPFNKETKTGNLISTNDWETIARALIYIDKELPDVKTVLIDDAQYIMSYEFMARAKERGFDKFVEIAQHMFNVLTAPDKLRDDLTVIYLSHSDDVSANGYTKTKIKTIGKMLDEKITIEGLFTIVLLCLCYRTSEKKMDYVFVTMSNGTTTAKSPMGMFEGATIPNDLQFVLDKVKEYNNGE